MELIFFPFYLLSSSPFFIFIFFSFFFPFYFFPLSLLSCCLTSLLATLFCCLFTLASHLVALNCCLTTLLCLMLPQVVASLLCHMLPQVSTYYLNLLPHLCATCCLELPSYLTLFRYLPTSCYLVI
jgi:hypothetical protein